MKAQTNNPSEIDQGRFNPYRLTIEKHVPASSIQAIVSPAEKESIGPQSEKQPPESTVPIPTESRKGLAEEPGPPTKDTEEEKGESIKGGLSGPTAPPTAGSEKKPELPGGETKGASPQAEDGHTDIANELAEALARTNLSAYEGRILWTIFRKTYGWHKKVDRISITQFEKATGLHRRHVQRTLAELIKRNIVARIGYSRIISYQFQKDYSKWRDIAKRGYTKKPSAPKGAIDRSLKGLTQKKLTKEKALGAISGEISSLAQKLFPTEKERELFDQVIKAVSSTRKTGRLSPSIILAQLKDWEKYPVAQVQGGMQIYLSKGYYQQGFKVKYLLGIIKNHRPGEVPAGGFVGWQEETRAKERRKEKYAGLVTKVGTNGGEQ